MSADWEFYICPVDDRPALVFVDLGLCDEVPDPERPWLLRVTVKMLLVRDDGLGDQEETEALYAIEDGLFEALARGLGARYVGRITSQGNRDLFYYANSDEGFTDSADTIMAGFSKYEYQCRAQQDPQWEAYHDLLYPSDLDLQSIHNRRIVDRLTESGDDLTQPRDVDHWLYFPSEHSRSQFVKQVDGEGFLVELVDAAQPDAEFPLGVHLIRRDRVDLDAIDALVTDLFLRAQTCGGEYDGWGAPVVRK